MGCDALERITSCVLGKIGDNEEEMERCADGSALIMMMTLTMAVNCC